MDNVTVDLKRLREEGIIDVETAQTLLTYRERPLWLPILQTLAIIFGAIMTIGGVVGLFQSPEIGLALSFLTLAVSYFLYYKKADKFVARALQTLGALGLIASIFWYVDHYEFVPSQSGAITLFSLVTLILVVTSVTQLNLFLGALVPIALAHVLGSGTAYWHAGYGIFVEKPLFTVIVFGVLAFGSYALLPRFEGDKKALAVVFARVSFFIMQFGFWVGSLWGDDFGGKNEYWEDDYVEPTTIISENWFSVAWFVFLIAMIIWGARKELGYVRVTATVFLGIHFYTQYFETFYDNPVLMLIAGLSLFGLGIAASLWLGRWVNKSPLDFDNETN